MSTRAKHQAQPVQWFPNRPYERRSVCVLPVQATRDPNFSCKNGSHTHWTRSKVTAAVGRGEMRWIDKHHNVATFVVTSVGSWKKTRSGPVATMQFIKGEKGRYVPASQREIQDVDFAHERRRR